MNRSSGPRKRADLCNSTQQYLNIYAIAASAAGVGMLALAQPGAAKIVNTPTHHIIDKNDIYHLDLNHDGIIDFSFVNTHACGTDMCLNSLRVSPSGRENGAAGRRCCRPEAPVRWDNHGRRGQGSWKSMARRE